MFTIADDMSPLREVSPSVMIGFVEVAMVSSSNVRSASGATQGDATNELCSYDWLAGPRNAARTPGCSITAHQHRDITPFKFIHMVSSSNG